MIAKASRNVMPPCNHVKPATPTNLALMQWLDTKRKHNERRLAELERLFLLTSAKSHPVNRSLDATQARATAGLNKRPVIAVIDDEAVVAVTLTEILDRRGFETVWFTDPMCALAKLKVLTVALVISDIDMPILNGLELAERVSAGWPHCAILLLTGHPEHEATVSCVASRVKNFAFALKPIGVCELLRLVLNLLQICESQVSASEAIS